MQGVNPRTVGVVIGRFQTPELTEAHRYLFEQVATRVPRVLVLVGCSPYVGMKRNPMEYTLRQRMVEDYWLQAHPNIPLTVMGLPDRPDDIDWARRVDDLIGVVSVGGPVIMFGGPDSACPTYEKAGGRHPIEILDAKGGHATKVRAAILPVHTADFRRGVCYAVDRKFVRPYQTIDAVVFNEQHQVALIKKHEDGGLWRLPGGHLDPADNSIEECVRREVQEELHLEVGDVRYIHSARVNDWRYRGGPEGIMTAVFSAKCIFGAIKAGDDADAANWFELKSAVSSIHTMHKDLLERALGAMNWRI